MNLISEDTVIYGNDISMATKDKDRLQKEIARLTRRNSPPGKENPGYNDDMVIPSESELFSKNEETVFSPLSAAEEFPEAETAQRVIDELLLRQAELEKQFAELRESYYALELQLERYKVFYDFAPVGYLSLDRNGNILKSNYAVKGLVGLRGAQINQLPFARFVVDEDQPLFARFLEKVFSVRGGKQSCELRLCKKGSATISVQMEAQVNGSGLECMAVVMDITRLHRNDRICWSEWDSPDSI